MSEYKLDTDSDGNIMLIRMHKELFQQTSTNNLNISIKIAVCMSNNSFIPHVGKCEILFVVPGNGWAILETPCCEQLLLPTATVQVTNTKNSKLMNKQSKEIQTKKWSQR